MKKNLILFVIISFAFFIRTYKLSPIPPHLTPDEASLGYNAYSILKTGRDEYGVLFPMIFKSFGDYKPGLYIYASVPFIAIFGLNEFSVRIVSAVSGVFAVVLVYFITKYLFKNEHVSLLSAFFLATMPWHIHFSRGAWEANFSLTLTLAGLYFLVKSKNKNLYLCYSAIFFGLTLLAYQGAKLTSSLVILAYIVTNLDLLKRVKVKYVFTSLVLGLLFAYPAIKSFFDGRTGRLVVFSVFSYPRPKEYLESFLSESGVKKNSLFYYVFYSENLNFFRGMLGRFFNHFSGRFLFFEGDWQNPRHSSPYHGMLLITSLPIFLVGLISLVKQKFDKNVLFLLLLLFFMPLPAVLSRDSVHAIRSLPLTIPLAIVLAFGAVYLLKKYKKIGGIFILFLFAGGFIFFLENYFVQMPVINAKYWEYGYKQIVEVVSPIQDNYEKIYIQQSYSQPYIYFLFYQKYDPLSYQKQAFLQKGESEFDVGKIEKIDNIYFNSLNWQNERGKSKSLFAADTIRIPIEDSSDERYFNVISEIKDPNDNIIFRVLEIK